MVLYLNILDKSEDMPHLLRFFFLLFFFALGISYSQDYTKVDSIVSKYPKRFGSAAKLAKLITNDFDKDSDKVRAVFYWIANNVKYDPKYNDKFGFVYGDKADFLEKEKKYNAKLAGRVLSKGAAVCEGYSVLFTAVCSDLGITSRVVSGAAKTMASDIGKRFYSDHSWNIVEINGKSFLIDVTWGAGSYDTSFKKELDNSFYLADPKTFINRHYPENYKDALLKEKISKEQFSRAPLLYESDFTLIAPTAGILKKHQKKVRFQFLCRPGTYAVDYDIDSKQFSLGDIKSENDRLSFEITLQNTTRARELVVYIYYKPIVLYRLMK